MTITELDIQIAEKFYGFERIEHVYGEGEFFKAGIKHTFWYKDGQRTTVDEGNGRIYNLSNPQGMSRMSHWSGYDSEAFDLLKDALKKWPQYFIEICFQAERDNIHYSIRYATTDGNYWEPILLSQDTSYAKAVCRAILRLVDITN